MSYNNGSRMTTNGLQLCLDAGNVKSYAGSGTSWSDLTKTVSVGTFGGSPVFNQNNNGSISFSGASQYVSFGNNLKFSYTSSFTLEAWVFYGYSAASYPAIISKEDYGGSSDSFGYGLKVDQSNGQSTGNYLPYLVVTGPSPTSTRSYRYGNINIRDNKWHHIVGVYTGGATPSIDIYTDGVLTNGTSNFVANGGNPTNSGLYVATNEAGGAISANVAVAKVYNLPLSANEILQNYNATRTRFTITSTNIVTDSLALNLDVGRLPSYRGTGATWYDLASSARNVTMYNAGGTTYSSNPAGAPTFSSANFGKFTFDGVNDWGKFSQFNVSSNVTVSIWLKTSNAGGGGLLSHCSGGPVNLGYQISGGKMYYQYYTGPWQAAQGTTSVVDGNWKHCVWAKSGTSMLMYINGVLDATLTLVGDVTGPLCCVGSLWGPCNSDSYGAGTDSYGSVFSGDIASVLVHTKTLSGAEVLQNFNAMRGRFGV